MIASALYQPLYLLLVLVLTVYIMRQYSTVDYYPHDYENLRKEHLTLILLIFLIVVIGFRPHKGFVDTGNYVESYTPFLGMSFTWSWDVDNFLFDNLYAYLRSLCIPIDYFFLLIAFVVLISAYSVKAKALRLMANSC